MSRLPRREFLKLTAASALGFAGQQKPDQGGGRQWAKIAQNFVHHHPRHGKAFGLLRSWCAVTEFGQTGGRRCQVHASVLHSAPMQPQQGKCLDRSDAPQARSDRIGSQRLSVEKRCPAFAQVAFSSRLLNPLVRTAA
jgi:hypothetical protein